MSKPSTKKKSSLLAPIDSRAAALEAIQQSAIAFFAVALIQGVVGVFLSPTMLIDAAIFVALGLALFYFKSRIVALLLLLLSGFMAISTIMNAAGLSANGGSNVFVALVVVGAALRAVEATFKLHGRFAHEPDDFSPNEPLPLEPPKQTESGFSTLEKALVGLVLLLLVGLAFVVVVVIG